MNIPSNFFSKTLKILSHIFAIVGVGLTFSYFAIRFQWTNEKGSSDINNSRYDFASSELNFSSKDSVPNAESINNAAYIIQKILILAKHYPANAAEIFSMLNKTGDYTLANKMVEAINIKTADSLNLSSEFERAKSEIESFDTDKLKYNAFDWINLEEWAILKAAVAKDKELIDSAAKVVGVEPRLVTTVLVAEQIRKFKSSREIFKRVLSPLKILSVSNYMSFGVTGIKEATASKVERFMRDRYSPYYLGAEYENLIEYRTLDTTQERMDNLMNYKNQYYSYLYAALILKQVRTQWKKAGYDISDRPEILATLFNVGFEQSKPKTNPIVGGSKLTAGEKEYTFGGFSYEFYYSGELADLFPYQKEKWIEEENLHF